jgi:hypothetical protein
MADRDQRFHHFAMGMAKAIFMERLHVLRLTEIVRYGVRPNEEGLMLLPNDIDEQMRKQAFDFLLAMMPEEFHVELLTLRTSWLTPQ